MAICLSRIESALSISVRSSNSSNSSGTVSVCCTAVGGALSLPFREAKVCCFTAVFTSVLGDG
jgi:hypothetical protein